MLICIRELIQDLYLSLPVGIQNLFHARVCEQYNCTAPFLRNDFCL